jgi:hypothetical protein
MLTFEELPRSTQREVERLARKGRKHSDPVVAEASLRWARQVLGERANSKYALGFAVDMLVAAIGGGGGTVSGINLARRRLAKQLMALELNGDSASEQ